MEENNIINNNSNLPKISFFVIDYSHGGGVEKATLKLMELFQQNNIPIYSLLSLVKTNEVPMYDYPKNISVQVLGDGNSKEIQQNFEKLFIHHRPDVLIFQGDNITISLAILAVCKKYGIKALPQFHGSPYAYLRKYIFASDLAKNPFLIFKLLHSNLVFPFKKTKMGKYVKSAVDGLFAVSFGSKNEFTKIFGNQSTENINTIYNPLTLKLNKDISSKKNEITYLGRLEKRHKNSMLILQTWQLIFEKYPDWKLRIIGDGTLKSKMIEFVEKNKLLNVEFLGFVKNVSDYLNQSSISVSTSNCEGFGISILEAMSNGNAIAATDSDGGMSDIVIDNITGLVSPKNNAKELASNIEILISNESKRMELIKNGFEHIQKLYSTNIVEQWKSAIGIQ